jgi:hypothetical protein
VKFSLRQILASTAGAVIAAIVASTFGVKGTIIGVAIGSAAATMATALVAQSIERGHEAVKQAVVKAPETATLLRKLGGTGLSGDTTSSAPTQVVRSGPSDEEGAQTVPMASTAAPVGETERLEISAVADAPATERLRATTSPMPPAIRRPVVAGRLTWRGIAASAVVVFVLALLLITAVELISGKPLSAIFGGSDVGTSLRNFFDPTPTATTPTTTPTTTTSTTAPTSTTTPASSTTTTAVPGATATSTTAPTGGVTSTTSPAPTHTTTTVVTGGASTTTTSAP